MDFAAIYLGLYTFLQVLGLGMYLGREDSRSIPAFLSVLLILGLVWAVGSLLVR